MQLCNPTFLTSLLVGNMTFYKTRTDLVQRRARRLKHRAGYTKKVQKEENSTRAASSIGRQKRAQAVTLLCKIT